LNDYRGVKKMVSFGDFKKLELKTAKITKVEEVPEKDKLYKMEIDLGGEQRTIVAGLKEFYSAEELTGKMIVVVANLDPAVIAGIKSEAMLLAAVEGGKTPTLIIADREVAPGLPVE